MIKFGKDVLQTGLDIGSSHIKIAQLMGKGEGLQLVNFDVVKIESSIDGVKKALDAIAKRLPAKEVNISISGPSTVVRYIDLPKMSDDELKSSMKFEAEKYIPFNLKDVIIDCQSLDKGAKGKMKVLLAAAKKDAIKERIDLVEGSGLTVRLIDCDPFALINAFIFNFPDIKSDNNIALVNLGEKKTIINILKGNIAVFTRELQIGGWDLAKAISEKMRIDMNAAAALKEDPGDKAEEVTKVTALVLARIIEEIKLSLSYYENQVGAVVSSIYLSGGLSSLKGLPDVFKEGMGVECASWDPVKNVRIDTNNVIADKLEKSKSRLHIAVGLAMRE